MDSSWNFHGHIALPLETIAQQVLKNDAITADSIETGNFVRVMYEILDQLEIDDTEKFICLCNDYLDKPKSEIPAKVAKNIFDEFLKISNL